MRRFAPAAVLLMLVLAGCAGDDEGTAAWEDRPKLEEDGTLRVDEYASFQDEVDARSERSLVLVAGEFLRLDESDAARTTVVADAGPESAGPATVTVTLAGLQDDSVAARRYVLQLSREGETWKLGSGTWSQRCQQGRGHRDFSPADCV